MDIKKVFERLLVFFVGLPLLLALVILLPQKNHLAFNLLTTVLSGVGGLEVSLMLGRRGLCVSRVEGFIAGLAAPLACTLYVSFGINFLVIPSIIMAAAAYFLISRVFTRGADWEAAAGGAVCGLFSIFYPGTFLAWTVWLSGLTSGGRESGILIACYLLAVFANDSLAWAAGSLFGKGNRGFVKCSPNKSVVGFAAGLAASLAVTAAAASLFPAVFPGGLPASLVLGLAVGCAAITGDLAESALKRGCSVKDSGLAIPGRGGALDSLDSLAIAAPVFVILYKLLYA